jgi:pimeloyl-ACP methyl ester carboxylesterase/membrane protein DedA with SNARE-associated domain
VSRPRLRYAIALYAGLLAASHLVRRCTPDDLPPRPGQSAIELDAVAGAERMPRRIRMAYYDTSPGSGDRREVVLLLHGTPFASETFGRLTPLLAERYRVLVPDLPGFGRSTRRIPDYSIRAHAGYLLQLLDRIGVKRCHVVGYSQGGGAALHLWSERPAAVASVTLLSSIGVQELEMLGDYSLNQALYRLQWAALWLLYEATPHFGLLDGFLLDLPYGRSFLDSDQRPLRGILERLEPPALILHGREDFLVPLSAAEEHARIVPQSRLVVMDGGHELVFSRPEEIRARLESFFEQAGTGVAPARAAADPIRIADAARPFDRSLYPPAQGIALFTLLMLLALATWISEDLTCLGAGLLVAHGALAFWPATLACVAGIFTGDVLLYLCGRWIGQPLIRRPPFRWFIREADVARCKNWFRSAGPAVIIASRFTPGTRLPTYVAVGVLGMPFWKFCVFFLAAAGLWTPLLTGLSAAAGHRAANLLASYTDRALPAALAALLLVWLVVRLVLPTLTFRGRRLLLSSWRRLTRWEFWPLWAFYPPVAGYILWLGVRHRCPTLFTACNPALPGGGFVGESKSDILNRLGPDADHVAPHVLLPAGTPRVRAEEIVRGFMAKRGLDFPIVLKPDAGQRGQGVSIVRDPGHLDRWLQELTRPWIAQAHVAGLEYGIFYYRRPDEPRGHIFAITDKRFPVVTGDGSKTLERLILGDDRAVCKARFFLRRHAAHLSRVPAAGEIVPLVEVGTHALGCLFLDGSHLATPELEDAMDRVTKRAEGIYFGRYDVRTPSVEHLRRGEFKVIELNGVTSEATSIYDPGHGLFWAYRKLMAQWSIAFEIGALNRARGAKPSTVRELLNQLRDFKPAGEGDG